MSKIVCDICGTSYPETAKQCPICGSVRPGDAQRVTNEVKSDGNVSTGYTHIKGGRFSKSNVKKRTKAQPSGSKNRNAASGKNQNDEDAKSNRGLVVTAIVLLLAIIGVVIYIAVRFFAPISDPNAGNTTENLGSNIDLSCRDLTLDTYTVLFDQEGAAKLLDVKTIPEKPSETITYSSDNEAVATVTDKGKITAVAEGTAKITVTCGKVTKECIVTVQFTSESTQNTTPDATEDTTVDTTAPTDETKPTEELRLNRKDSFTLQYKGEVWDLYTGSIPRNLITWSISDTSVATVDNGKVTAVGEGYTYVYAEYEGQKVSCQVICNWKESSGIQGNGGVSEDGGGSSTTTKTGVITNVSKDANVRKGPGTSYEKDGTIALGTKVTIYEQKVADGYTWCRIGENRWVASNYIKIN